MHKLQTYLKNTAVDTLRNLQEKKAENYLKKNGVWEHINEIRGRSSSTGVSIFDYAYLYRYIQENRPRFVLECGTGVSTHVIALAMDTHCKPVYRDQMKFVSMESKAEWYEQAKTLLPAKYDYFLELRHSPLDFFEYAFVRGTVYREVPAFPYDLVFVDGPDQKGRCNMDFVRQVTLSDKPVTALVDNRKRTLLAYAALFGKKRVKTNLAAMVRVGPVSRADLVNEPGNLQRIYQENLGVGLSGLF